MPDKQADIKNRFFHKLKLHTMNFLPTKYLLFLTIIFSFNNIEGQTIDTVYKGKSYPGVLFDNPYANQKFNGTWVIKGWDGNDKLFDSLLVKGLSMVDPSIDSSFYKSTYKYQDSLVILNISHQNYAKIISIPGCADCSFISHYDLNKDVLYTINPAYSSNELIITRNPNGETLNVKLGYYVNDTIYKEKSFVLEEMYKYTSSSFKLKLPKKTKSLKLKDIDKLEFEYMSGKVYGDSLISNNEYQIYGNEIGTITNGTYREITLKRNSILDLKNDIIQLRVKGTLQKFFVGVIVKTNNGNRYVHNFKFKVNEKDEIVLY